MSPFIPTTDFGTALRKYRESKRLTGRAFSELTGISQGHLSELENSRRNLTTGLIERISAAFGVSQQNVIDELDQISQTDSSESLVREMPAPYNVKHAPPDDMHQLAAWLVGRMEKPEIAAILNEFTVAALGGDDAAGARARALLLLIQTSNS